MNNGELQKIEMAVLGAMLVKNEIIDDVLLKPANFHHRKHALIYEAIKFLWPEKPVDALTVGDELLKRGQINEIGGREFFDLCQEEIISPTQAPIHAEIIFKVSQRRRLKRLGVPDADEPGLDPAEIAKAQIDKLQDILDNETLEEKPDGVAEGIEDIGKHQDLTHALKTGFPRIDLLTGGGLLPGKLWVLAANPGVGKTTLATRLALKIAQENYFPVVYFSSEQTKREIQEKCVSALTGREPIQIRGGFLADKQELKDAQVTLGCLKYFVDTKTLRLADVALKARLWVRRYGVALVIVDYLQRYLGSIARNKSRSEIVGEMARALKTLAQECEVPVLALSQLNRESRRDNRPPKMFDLRDSGEIEQEADVILFLHRQLDAFSDNAEFFLAKNRDFGKTGKVTLQFDNRWQTYTQKGDYFQDQTPF